MTISWETLVATQASYCDLETEERAGTMRGRLKGIRIEKGEIIFTLRWAAVPVTAGPPEYVRWHFDTEHTVLTIPVRMSESRPRELPNGLVDFSIPHIGVGRLYPVAQQLKLTEVLGTPPSNA